MNARRATHREQELLDHPDPGSVPTVSWRSELVGGAAVTILAGLFLVLAPLLFTYRSGDPALHDVLVGALIVALTIVRLVITPWRAELSWVALVLGAWMAVATLLLGSSMTVRWTEAAVGALVMVTSALSGSATNGARRRGSLRAAGQKR